MVTVAPLRELGGPLVCKPDGGMAFALLSRRTPGASPKVGATCVAQTVRKEMKRTEQNRTGQDRTGRKENKKDYTSWCPFDEKGSTIPGGPGTYCHAID